MNSSNNEHIVKQHFKDLKMKYRELSLRQDDNGIWYVYGNLKFFASYKGEDITDEYEIEIYMPKEYPDTKPYAFEKGGKIPKDFHKNSSGILCMDVPVEAQRKFSQKPDLVSFVDNLLIHYLYSYSYKVKYGKTPWGEYSHFGEGLLEYYRGIFDIEDDFTVLHFLYLMAQVDLKGHFPCPCGSGERLRKCIHWEQIMKLRNEYSPDGFLLEYNQVIRYYNDIKNISIPRNLISNKILKRIKRIMKDTDNHLLRNYK